jgi:hypothetical protein
MIQSRASVAAVLAGVLPGLLSAQTTRLTFEVASIKPAKPGARGGGIQAQPAGQE